MSENEFVAEAEEHIATCNKIIETLAKDGKDNMRKLGTCLAENDKLKKENQQLKCQAESKKRAILGKFATEWVKQLNSIKTSWEQELKLSYDTEINRK